MQYQKIIIVGETNICRSFMAETILQKMLDEKAKGAYEVQSRGLVVLFSEPVSEYAVRILERHGYPVKDRRSQQFEEKDLQADLILTITDEIAAKLRETYNPQMACMSIAAFTDTEGPKLKVTESEESYEEVLSAMEPLMEEVVWHIMREF